MSAEDARERLRTAAWLQRDETRAIFELLEGAEGRIRAVGGVVRDTLLGRAGEAFDIDFATELLPNDVMARAQRAGIAAYPTGIEHGTITLRIGDETAEVTTLREDVETDGRHAVVKFGTDWRRDAERRDFTLNALYAGMDGEVFDPLGGLEDCLAQRVRFIGDPDQRIAEDRLRVYRFFRFSTSHGQAAEGKFDPDGLAACRRAAGSLGGLSAERVGVEMRRLLALPRITPTLATMTDARILALPTAALDMLAGYERMGRPTLTGRLAILIDATNVKTVQAAWRLSNEEIDSAVRVLGAAELLRGKKLNEAVYRFRDVLEDGLVLAALKDGWSEQERAEVRAYIEPLLAQPWRFPLSGDDLIERGFRPGKELGVELARLEKLWIDSGFALDRE
ncbi:MAG TPA: CCA tRNA nucleotidyltransferase, partial [Arsenicitalea sp.]|nr:CCA tRNA nucleotidyltransferase [Arsenicitalea sp.]